MDRRSVLLGLGATTLVGCATPGSALVQIFESYRALEKTKDNYAFSRADIDAYPAGVLGAQVENGAKGLLVWQKREGEVDFWKSGNYVTIEMARGRLIRTSGFPLDQLDSRLTKGVDPLGTPLDRTQSYQFTRQIQVGTKTPPQEVRFELSYQKDRTVDLHGLSREVSVWGETLSFPETRRRWRQTIEIDRSSGEVLRSIQHVGKKIRVILELLQAPKIT